MSNFHCVPDGCGRVVYREYLPPVVRWQYKDEPENEILADEYTLTTRKGRCFKEYIVTIRLELRQCGGNLVILQSSPQKLINGKIEGIDLKSIGNNTVIVLRYQSKDFVFHEDIIWQSSFRGLSESDCQTDTYNSNFRKINKKTSIYEIFDVQPLNQTDVDEKCEECTLKIFNNKQLVHQEIRSVCPEIKKLDCRLSDEVKEIKIDKLFHLEAIEIADFARDTIFKAEIPKHCLNIYKTFLQPSIIPLPDLYPDYEFIAQICSAVGCPPPEYQVICDCDCEECPDSTCAIECGNVICCYNTEGRSIKSIPIENYCGGTS